MMILKEVFVKFIDQARRGVDVKLDLKIGFLHCYPNGDFQFENYDYSQEDADQRRFEKRQIQEQNSSDAYMNKVSNVLSSASKSIGFTSCNISVMTPFTVRAKSQLKGSVAHHNRLDWYKKRKS